MSASTFCRRPHSVSYLKPQRSAFQQSRARPSVEVGGKNLASTSFASDMNVANGVRNLFLLHSVTGGGLGFPHHHPSSALPWASGELYSLHSEIISSHPVVINVQKDFVSLHGCTQNLEKET